MTRRGEERWREKDDDKRERWREKDDDKKRRGREGSTDYSWGRRGGGRKTMTRRGEEEMEGERR